MKISVVTAVFNRQATIGDAIDSVRAQSWANVEHIIQDGGSSDGTLEPIRGYSSPNMSIASEPDTGIYDALNRGIRRATGDVIGLMHSDDLFAHNRVLEMVAAALENTDIDGTYGDVEYIAKDDASKVIRYWRSGEYHPRLLKRGWMPPHPTVYLRREVFDRLGLYDTSFEIAGDYDAMLRYLAKGGVKLAYIPEVMVKMRVGGESSRSFERIVRKSAEDLRALRKNQVGGYQTLAAKNLSKVRQFIQKDGSASD